jgi:hypothetical protein
MDAARACAHPNKAHIFGDVVRHESETLVCNGEVALRITRGHWDIAELPEASPEFLARFFEIPWDHWPPITIGKWRALDDERGRLGFGGRYVRTGECHLARIESLRLIARLPRCDVWPLTREDDPLPFRFTGGIGLVGCSRLRPKDDTSRGVVAIMQPRYHYDGTPVAPSARIDLGLPGWPPPPPAE